MSSSTLHVTSASLRNLVVEHNGYHSQKDFLKMGIIPRKISLSLITSEMWKYKDLIILLKFFVHTQKLTIEI
jgi:hypothetical protein